MVYRIILFHSSSFRIDVFTFVWNPPSVASMLDTHYINIDSRRFQRLKFRCHCDNCDPVAFELIPQQPWAIHVLRR